MTVMRAFEKSECQRGGIFHAEFRLFITVSERSEMDAEMRSAFGNPFSVGVGDRKVD
jgi:hypothetical protein